MKEGHAGKTKVMKCWVSMGQVKVFGINPCSVCMKGVGRNSILDKELVLSGTVGVMKGVVHLKKFEE